MSEFCSCTETDCIIEEEIVEKAEDETQVEEVIVVITREPEVDDRLDISIFLYIALGLLFILVIVLVIILCTQKNKRETKPVQSKDEQLQSVEDHSEEAAKFNSKRKLRFDVPDDDIDFEADTKTHGD